MPAQLSYKGVRAGCVLCSPSCRWALSRLPIQSSTSRPEQANQKNQKIEENKNNLELVNLDSQVLG
eukprot:5255073-Amphidinium_carterae.1